MKRYADLLVEARTRVRELLPWDLAPRLEAAAAPLLLDVREPAEFARSHIAGSLNVPRGVLEGACEWGFDDTEPRLVSARQNAVVVVCRSGNRSLLAAEVLQALGFEQVASLNTGVRGWNDADLPLVDDRGQAVSGDDAEVHLAARVRPDQLGPA